MCMCVGGCFVWVFVGVCVGVGGWVGVHVCGWVFCVGVCGCGCGCGCCACVWVFFVCACVCVCVHVHLYTVIPLHNTTLGM